MTTNQPNWQFVANLGDVNPLDHGGFFVYRDLTGVYSPECVLLTPLDDENGNDTGKWEVRRFCADKCTFIDGVLSDNRFHPSKPAWFARKDETRPQDGNGLADIASFCGQTEEELIALFTSDDACKRAHAWRLVGEYHGFANLDAYPETLTRKDVFNLYRSECFPRSVRRASGKRVLTPSGEVGPFAVLVC